MPLYLLIGAAQILFIVHAARTGRPYYWMMIILWLPVFGILAYIVFELVPNAHRSPTARNTMRNAQKLVNPEGDYRKLTMQLEVTPTVANKRALADECVRLGRLDEAEALYRDGMTGIHATDPALMLGIARVRFAQGDPAGCLSALDALKAANPDFQSADGHMLYARSLEGLSRDARRSANMRRCHSISAARSRRSAAPCCCERWATRGRRRTPLPRSSARSSERPPSTAATSRNGTGWRSRI
jgi:hypothetical protein